jgi:hypothetical protein
MVHGLISSLLDPEYNDRVHHLGPGMHFDQHLQAHLLQGLTELQDLRGISIAHNEHVMLTYRVQDAPQSLRAPRNHQCTRPELPHQSFENS